ncbi:MAG TPA: calcium-binding protein, partial [Longimicrobiales bacterium]|nr:calcium-binding protein [Longimicrobiales bacterium]
DLIRGGAGDDRIFGQADADTIFGESGSDTIEGGSGLDVIFGGAGDDVLDGGAGDDVVLGDTGGPDFADVESILSAGLIERLRGAVESFESELDGEGPTLAGEDRIAARGGSDLVDGQAGSDRYEIGVRGADTSARVRVFDSGASPLDTDRLTIDGTSGDDQFLLRAAADPTGLAFVASINRDDDVERIDYDGVEALVVNGLFGDDRFALDDVRGSTTLNGGGGDDFFQVGQLYRSRRTNADANVAIEDQFATTETTRGFLSNGISAPTVINGGNDNDEIVVFRNLAALQVNGQDGDDDVTVRAFALVNPEDRLQEETRISGGGGADTIRYAVNAPVSIDGGDGLDSVTVIGTEFADEFVVTKDGVFGSGLNVEFVSVELLRVDGAEGDDSFYIQSTHESILTQVVGGLGSDTFQVADGVERAVTSNDLLGHSGLVLHDVESNDPVFQGPEGLGIAVGGISANVADADEPGIVISETDGFTRLAEGGLVDRYTIVLTRRPEQEVFVKALAPGRSREEIARGEENFRVFSGGNDESDGSGTTLVFDENDWWIPQTVFVEAFDDAALEGERFGVIQHLATSADTRTGLIGSVAAPFFDEDGDVVTDVVLETGLESDQTLVGRLFEVVSAPAGRTSGGLGQSLLVKSSETIGGVTRLRLFGAFDPEDLPLAGSGYRIAFYDGLQLPNVTVQIDDDDEADVLLTEVQDLRVFEGGLGDASSLDAFAAYQVELSRAPRDGETVFVDLDVTSANDEADQLRLSLDRPGSSGGAAGSGVLRLVFRADPADPLAWNRPQTVYVEAIDDAAREGFHRGLIEHRVTTASGADVDEIVQIEGETIDLTDALGEPGTTSFVLLEALPVQFRGDVREATSDTIAGFAGDAFSVGDLDRALEGQDRSGLVVRVTKGAGAGQVRDVVSIDEGVVRVDRPWDTLPDETSRFSISQLVVEVDGERLAPERFELNGSTVVFFDAESRVEERTASTVRVSYGVLDLGFEGRVEERLSVRVVDDDTAAVLILESDLSTDVIESNPDESGREAIPDTYQVVLSRPPGRPDPLSNEPGGDFEAEGPAFVE